MDSPLGARGRHQSGTGMTLSRSIVTAIFAGSPPARRSPRAAAAPSESPRLLCRLSTGGAARRGSDEARSDEVTWGTRAD